MSDGQVIIDTELNTSGMSKGLKSLGGIMKGGIGVFGAVTTAITGVASAVTGATAGLYSMVESSAQAGDRVDKLSQKIGISREAFQEFDFICSQSGTSVETLRMSVKTLANAMDSANNGTASAIEKFERLGVSIYDSNGALKSQEDMMMDVMVSLQGMEAGAEKTALAQDLFGRSAQELAPLLNSEAGSIEEMKEKAHELGLVLSDEVVDSSVKLTDTIDQIKRAFSSVATNLGAEFMPTIQNIADLIVENVPTIREMITQLSPVFMNLINTVAPVLMQVVQNLLPMAVNLISTLLPILSKLFESLIPVVLSLLEALLPLIESILDEALMPIIEGILPFLIEIINQLVPVIQEMIPILIEIVLTILPVLLEVLTTLLPIIVTILRILPPLLDLIASIVPVLAIYLDYLLILVKVVASVLDLIVNMVVEAVTFILGFLKFLIDSAVEFFTPFWEKISTFANNFIDIIKSTFAVVLSTFKDYFKLIGLVLTGNIDKARELGKNMVEGLWNGIKENWTKLTKNLKELATGLLDTVKSTLGIASPSKEFKKLGKFCAEGLSIGFDEVNPLDQISSSLSVGMSGMDNSLSVNVNDSGIAGAIYGAMSNMGIYMDGQTVGRLVADGVNQQFGVINRRRV